MTTTDILSSFRLEQAQLAHELLATARLLLRQCRADPNPPSAGFLSQINKMVALANTLMLQAAGPDSKTNQNHKNGKPTGSCAPPLTPEMDTLLTSHYGPSNPATDHLDPRTYLPQFQNRPAPASPPSDPQPTGSAGAPVGASSLASSGGEGRGEEAPPSAPHPTAPPNPAESAPVPPGESVAPTHQSMPPQPDPRTTHEPGTLSGHAPRTPSFSEISNLKSAISRPPIHQSINPLIHQSLSPPAAPQPLGERGPPAPQPSQPQSHGPESVN